MIQFTAALVARFWAKVDRQESSKCWEWTAHRNRKGYGQMGVGTGSRQPRCSSHRISWELHFGAIPDGLFVCHRCDNPPCVNPAHLFLGTHTENVADMTNKRRQAFGSRSGRSKLSESSVLEIRRLYDSGVSHKKLARIFGIGNTCAYMAAARKNWRHVREE